MISERPFIIIGAGMAGLGAALRLQRAGKRVVVIEKESQVGGRVVCDSLTEPDGAIVRYDRGAEWLTSRYGMTMDLLARNGLKTDALNPQRTLGRATGGSGGVNFVDITPGALLRGDVLSYSGFGAALRVGVKVWRHRNRLHPDSYLKGEAPFDDMTAAEFLADDSVLELLDALGESVFYTRKMSAAIYAMGLYALSVKSPLCIEGGMGVLSEALKDAIARDGGEVLSGAEVVSVREDHSGYMVGVDGRAGGRRDIEAYGVVCAAPSTEALRICDTCLGEEENQALVGLANYSSTAGIVMIVEPAAVLSGFRTGRRSFMFGAGCDLAAVNVALTRNSKGQQRVQITAYAAGRHGARLCAMNDDGVQDWFRRALAPVVARIMVEPTFDVLMSSVHRWPQALPICSVGGEARVQTVLDQQVLRVRSGRRLVFAGDYLGGPDIEGALISGAMAAEALL